MKITLITHAMCLIEIDNLKLLLDPIFYEKHTLAPANGGKLVNNPLVDIDSDNPILNSIDAILVTHIHRDHFDAKVLAIYGPEIQIICPNFYKDSLNKLGFNNILGIENIIYFKNISIKLTNGRHGLGKVGQLMGQTFGFVLNSRNNNKLYITGDTVWCDEIKEVLSEEKPNYILANTGNAILNGTKITMGKEDICEILSNSENSIILPVHLKAWNHCILERKELKEINDNRIMVLDDGESIELDA